MKLKSSELSGLALDWAVDQIDGRYYNYLKSREPDQNILSFPLWANAAGYSPSNNWSQGGPIIERECMTINCTHGVGSVSRDPQESWYAKHDNAPRAVYGPTPLIAAMRCYVASKLGNEIDVPNEFC